MNCRNCGHTIRKVDGKYQHTKSLGLNVWEDEHICQYENCRCILPEPMGGTKK